MAKEAEENRCLACTLNPVLAPGRVGGFMPIISTCNSRDRPASFRKSEQLQTFGFFWLLVMLAISVCYIWIIWETSGFLQLQSISEALNCWNATTVLVFGFINSEALILELNGLSAIIKERKSLLTRCTEKFIRRLSFFVISSQYAVLFVSLYKMAGDFKTTTKGVLSIMSLVAGGTCLSIIYTQSCMKIFLIKKLISTFHGQMKETLLRRNADVKGDVQKFVRMQCALVRNYRESARFWSPGLATCILLTAGNLIFGFYIMVGAVSDSVARASYNIELEMRIYYLIAGVVVYCFAQQLLEESVSKSYFYNVIVVAHFPLSTIALVKLENSTGIDYKHIKII